jgi:hypothetical protein
MNAGLANGFVRFGSTAHRILLYIHANREAGHRDFVEEFGDLLPNNIGITLTRLRRFGYIVKVRTLDPYIEKCRTQAVYRIAPRPGIEIQPKPYQNKSKIERSSKYRKRCKVKVPSVFQFRGNIPI